MLEGTFPMFPGTGKRATSTSSLRSIDMYSNNMSGSLPDFFKMSNLRNLKLDYNRFSGTFPKLPVGLTSVDLDANMVASLGPSHPFSFQVISFSFKPFHCAHKTLSKAAAIIMFFAVCAVLLVRS